MGTGGRYRDARGDRFPLVAALMCLGLILLLWFGSTVPALAERRQLEHKEQALARLHDLLVQRTEALRAQDDVLKWDPQAVLVEIDRLGLTPDELLAGREPVRPAAGTGGR